MSEHRYREDQPPDWEDIEKPWLVRRLTALTALVVLGGTALFFIILVVVGMAGVSSTTWCWWYLLIWLVLVSVVFVVRRISVGRYEKTKLGAFISQKRAYRSDSPVMQGTRLGAAIARAADDARIKQQAVAGHEKKTQALVERAEKIEAEARSGHAGSSTAEWLDQAKQAEENARSLMTSATEAKKGQEKQCAAYWLDAANYYDLAGDKKSAAAANRMAYRFNPYKPKSEDS